MDYNLDDFSKGDLLLVSTPDGDYLYEVISDSRRISLCVEVRCFFTTVVKRYNSPIRSGFNEGEECWVPYWMVDQLFKRECNK